MRNLLCVLALAVLSAVFLPGSPGISVATAATGPFHVEAPAARLEVGKPGTVEVRVVVPPGHHVYRDMIRVETVDASGLTVGAADLPPGLPQADPANPSVQRELYDLDVFIEVPVSGAAQPGTHEVRLAVTVQGCKGGLCYLPQTVEVLAAVAVVDKEARYAEFGGNTAWTAGAGGSSGAPAVDFGAVPASADVRPPGMGDKPHPARARLLVDQTGLRAGDTFRLGVHLEQDEGWHTYWRSPGDIGLPTEISWTLPEGATAAPFVFPTPHRYDVESIVSYGYDDQVVLFSEVTLPEDLSPGTHTLGAKVEWLICEVMCIPGGAELSLPVAVSAADAAPPTATDSAPLFDWFASQHPTLPTQLQGAAVEAAVSVDRVRGEDPFEVAFLVTPTGPGALDFEVREGEGTWPAFTPIVSNTWMVTDVAVSKTDAGALFVRMKGEAFEQDPLPEQDLAGGLLQFTVDGRPTATEVTLPLVWASADATVAASTSPLFSVAQEGAPPPAQPGTTTAGEPTEGAQQQSFGWMLLLAFVGGAILNIMPCVLPVLTLKLYSLVAQRDAGAAYQRKAAIFYSAGVVASFLALAVVVELLKVSFGSSVGWGFQFQYPGYVAGLATLVFAFGLSLFGVFEVPAMGANQAAKASAQEGMAGYFLTGIFTTLLATPCSAPFLGTGMGFAFSLPTWGVLLFFGVAGLGLAAPFLVIGFVPMLMRFLPRPGAWMETFKQLMGFTLMLTTVWLVDVLGAQIGMKGVTGFLVFLSSVGVAGWLFGTFGGPTQPVARQAGFFAGGVVLAVATWVSWVDLSFAEPEAVAASGTAPADLVFDDEIPWQPFSDARLEELEGHTVFVDFTAEWCFTCKVNERTVLETQTVRQGMAEHSVVPLKADWTRKDEEITRWLERYGRAGVPFYLVVPADRSLDPIPLGEVITPSSVVEALAQAGS